MIIDTHAHLNDSRLAPIAGKIVDEFKDNGIECCIIAGANLESSRLAIKQANELNQYAIIGTHPEDVREICDEVLDEYRELAKNDRCVGIGEIGLDYHYEDGEPKDVQINAFVKQIKLADELKLPIILHIREAYHDALEILKEYRSYLNNGILLHCYSSSAEMVKEFDKFDCYYALGGVITFKNAKKDEVIKAIKRDRLVVETDCPYMAPTPFRGQQNEPKYTNYVIDKIAQVLQISRDEVIEFTNKNTKRLFTRLK